MAVIQCDRNISIMATSDSTPAEWGETQERHEKTVTLTAYGPRVDECDTTRQFVDETFAGDDVDMFEQETEEQHNVSLEITLQEDKDEDALYAQEFAKTIEPRMTNDKELFLNEIDEDDLPDWMELNESRETVETHVNSIMSPISDVVSGVVEDISLEGLGYQSGHDYLWDGKWERSIPDNSVDADEGDTIDLYTRVKSGNRSNIEARRKLLHRSERSSKQRYEDDDVLYWSTQITVHMEAASNEEMETMNNELVPPIYKALAGVDGIHSVRVSDCAKTVETSGECYDV